jgi:hypothetical protein
VFLQVLLQSYYYKLKLHHHHQNNLYLQILQLYIRFLRRYSLQYFDRLDRQQKYEVLLLMLVNSNFQKLYFLILQFLGC